METSYQDFDAFGNAKRDRTTQRILAGLLVITCCLLVGVAVVAGVMSSDDSSSSSSDSNSSDDYCTSTACLQLAADLSASINTSVEPCDDFYHYVCDGWDNANSWIEVDYPNYGQFMTVDTLEKQAFLDAILYKTKPSLVEHSSVEKATDYFTTCLDSQVDQEAVDEDEFLQALLANTSFASSDDPNAPDAEWNDDSREGFQDAMVYLTQLGFNSLFNLDVATEKVPSITQRTNLWQFYAGYNGTQLITQIFEPIYQTYLGLNATQSRELAVKVAKFADALFAISTVTDDAYLSYDTLAAMQTVGNFSALSAWDSEYLDFTQLVLDVFSVEDSSDIDYFVYLSGGVDYFTQLGDVISAASPTTVQWYLWTSVLYVQYDFQEQFSQTRYETRTDFCFSKTKESYPFVYGYILFNEVYDDATEEFASTLASTIKIDGTKVLINNATWLDSESKEAALQKIEAMELYIGYPSRIKNGDNIDTYYKNAVSSSTSWMDNIATFSRWNFEIQNDTFWGREYSLTQGWPTIFKDTSSYDSWLTGINAFYVPTTDDGTRGNFFTIPVTISQPPFLDVSDGYPSALAYGGLGAVCGHEMSHGFDPSGSQYDFNGTYVGSIFSNESRAEYNAKMQCLVDQYDGIAVDRDPSTGEVIYVNGTQTITENVADNAGVWSSWTAWQNYLKENGDDKLLYGVSLTQEQLFFVGLARLWCETKRPGAYVNYTDVHAPNYARVIGPLQNNHHFADAFGCAKGSNMNPTTKCSVW